ncbi:Leucine-rich repeat protein kinase family protein [Abeliophyllum distichum]|uniref:Leucine-rich repeat protein kinase family protein n=1 Tax=Abeliophyllum distichum TaxID=126358 RepID=A0ABD1SC50_9LAMI
MPNENLNKWLHSSYSYLNIAQRLEIMIDMASALEYLHHGYPSPIVHCDLKPNNILLDENMVAHVADFGIAKFFIEDQRISLTKTLGTIGYMAPGALSPSPHEGRCPLDPCDLIGQVDIRFNIPKRRNGKPFCLNGLGRD